MAPTDKLIFRFPCAFSAFQNACKIRGWNFGFICRAFNPSEAKAPREEEKWWNVGPTAESTVKTLWRRAEQVFCDMCPFFWQVDAPPPAETKNPRGVFQWNASWGLMEYTWTVIGLECNKNVLIHTACKWGTSHKAFYYREIRLWDASLGFQWHAVPFKRYSV